MMGRFLRLCGRRVGEDRGSVGILMALVLFFVLGMVTMTYNTARLSTEKMRLQNAADAAALEHAAWQARGMNLIQNLNNEGYTALCFADELIVIAVAVNHVRYAIEQAARYDPEPISRAILTGLEFLSFCVVKGMLMVADWVANIIAGKMIYYFQTFLKFTPIIGYINAQQLARLNGAESVGGAGANFTVGGTTYGVYALGVSMVSVKTTFLLPVERAFVSTKGTRTETEWKPTEQKDDGWVDVNKDDVEHDQQLDGWEDVNKNDVEREQEFDDWEKIDKEDVKDDTKEDTEENMIEHPPWKTKNKVYTQHITALADSKRLESLKKAVPKFDFTPMISTELKKAVGDLKWLLPAPCLWICYKDRSQMRLMPLTVWDAGYDTQKRRVSGTLTRLTNDQYGHGGIKRMLVISAAQCVTGDVVKQSLTANKDKFCSQRPAGIGTGATAKLVPVSDALPSSVGNQIRKLIYH